MKEVNEFGFSLIYPTNENVCSSVCVLSHCAACFSGVEKSLAFSAVFDEVVFCTATPETVEQEKIFFYKGSLGCSACLCS